MMRWRRFLLNACMSSALSSCNPCKCSTRTLQQSLTLTQTCSVTSLFASLQEAALIHSNQVGRAMS